MDTTIQAVVQLTVELFYRIDVVKHRLYNKI